MELTLGELRYEILNNISIAHTGGLNGWRDQPYYSQYI